MTKEKSKNQIEIERLEKEIIELEKGCGEKPIDEKDGLVLSIHNGKASISKCGSNDEYCPLCAVKLQEVLAKLQIIKKMREDIKKEIDDFKQPNDFYDEEIRDKDLDEEEVIEATIKMVKRELIGKI